MFIPLIFYKRYTLMNSINILKLTLFKIFFHLRSVYLWSLGKLLKRDPLYTIREEIYIRGAAIK
jgi:hypothetical protein